VILKKLVVETVENVGSEMKIDFIGVIRSEWCG
jgi:hypothetical protein